MGAGRVVFTADRAVLQRCAPEAVERRGPWRHFEMHELEGAETASAGSARGERTVSAFELGIPSVFVPPVALREHLASAYWQDDPRARLAMCREAAAEVDASPTVLLALASAGRENGDTGAARAALESRNRTRPRLGRCPIRGREVLARER